jgi:FkbM family methyltransferase
MKNFSLGNDALTYARVVPGNVSQRTLKVMLRIIRKLLTSAIFARQRDRMINLIFNELPADLLALHLNVAMIAKFEHAAGGGLSYSQEGEDILLTRKLLNMGQPGFFIDVGAHHPIRFSNTYLLYRQGWRGINIDATPGSMKIFEHLRPDDINLEYAVSDKQKPLTFYLFAEPALNTCNEDVVREWIAAGWEPLESKEVMPRTLAEILDEHLPSGHTRIDLMNIDVEGEEMAVLLSNNWDKYQPEWIILEIRNTPVKKLFETRELRFLDTLGYELISRLKQSLILKRTP